MAIVTASDGILARVASFIDLTDDWTIFLWAKPITTTPSGGHWRIYCQLGSAGYIYLGSNTDTNDVILEVSDDGTTNFYDSSAVATPLGSWFWCAATYNSTTHDLKFYVNSATVIDTLNHNLSSFNFSVQDDHVFGSWFDSCTSYHRMWQATLTGAQLITESQSPVAVISGNLLSDNPLTGPANLNDISGNGEDFSVFSGSLAYSVGPLTPTNTSSTTAQDLGTLPVAVTEYVQDTPTPHDVWFSYTANAADEAAGEIGVYAYGVNNYAPRLSVWTGTPPALTGYLGIDTGTAHPIRPVSVPVTDGTTYYFRVRAQSPSEPLNSDLTLSAEQAPTDSFAGDVIFITDTDDGFPIAVRDMATGELLRFIPPRLGTESGDSLLADATFALIEGRSGDDINLNVYSRAGTLRGAALLQAASATSWSTAMRSDGDAAYYTMQKKFGQADTPVIKKFSSAPTLLQTWTMASVASGINLAEISVDPDAQILYWSQTGTNKNIHRYDLANSIELADLSIGQASYSNGEDILVLSDGTLLVVYNDGLTAMEVRQFQANGTLIHTYSLGAVVRPECRLARALDDPDSFWVWFHPTEGLSRFVHYDASTFAALDTFNEDEFTVGIGPDSAGDPSPTRFGNSESCPFFLLAGGSGTIIVLKQNLITGDTTEFDFGTSGSPLTPSSFTLSDGESQTFSSIPTGDGYAVNENVQANWSVTYTVSNGSPIDNISVNPGETVTVTAINTYNPPSETDPIRRLRQFEIPTDENKQIFISKLEVLLQSGVGLVNGQGSDPQVAFSLSRDGGKTWGPEHWTSAGKMGEYLQRVIWRQLGQARNPVGRIVVSDPVFWALIDAYFDATPGTS